MSIIDMFQDEAGKQWAVVTTSGARYIGKINTAPDADGWHLLKPAFDYVLQVGMTPDRGIAKQALALPLDNTTDAEAELLVRPTSLLFFCTMKDHDRVEYETLVKKALEMCEMARQQRSPILKGVTQLPKRL